MPTPAATTSPRRRASAMRRSICPPARASGAPSMCRTSMLTTAGYARGFSAFMASPRTTCPTIWAGVAGSTRIAWIPRKRCYLPLSAYFHSQRVHSQKKPAHGPVSSMRVRAPLPLCGSHTPTLAQRLRCHRCDGCVERAARAHHGVQLGEVGLVVAANVGCLALHGTELLDDPGLVVGQSLGQRRELGSQRGVFGLRCQRLGPIQGQVELTAAVVDLADLARRRLVLVQQLARTEEHTSELQS